MLEGSMSVQLVDRRWLRPCPYGAPLGVCREVLGVRRDGFFVASSKQAKQNCCEASDDVGLRSRELSYKRSDSILVDPASSHMLDSKIKPCTCQYNP